MRVGILVPELNLPGDAVGNDVAGMYKYLSQKGFDCVVFTAAPHTHQRVRSGTYQDVKSWLRKDDLLIYQYASGGQEALQIARDLTCTIIIRYHNVTPSYFFRGISEEYERTAEEGQDLLTEFLALPRCHAISASRFNSNQLTLAGLPAWRSGIVRPFHVVDDLLATVRADESQHLSDEFNLLAIGRISPNKRIELLLECYADVVDKAGVPLSLTIVGGSDPRLQLYQDRIEEVIKRRHLNGKIRLLEKLSIPELAECYRRADIFVTCSGHEGFCIPVIEAMAFGVPIVASSDAALPETCGDAGIICSDRPDFVEAILSLIANRELRVQLARRGSARYRQNFTGELIGQQLEQALWRTRHPFWASMRAAFGAPQ